jgi:hypothetical protein
VSAPVSLSLLGAHLPFAISLNSRHAPDDYGLAIRGKFQWSFLGIIFCRVRVVFSGEHADFCAGVGEIAPGGDKLIRRSPDGVLVRRKQVYSSDSDALDMAHR